MTTAPTVLLDDLVKEVNFRATNSRTVDSNLDATIRIAIEWAAKEFVRKTEPESYRTQGSISVVAGTQTYDLPEYFDQMYPSGVKFASSDYRTLTWIPREAFDRYQLDYTQGQGVPILYTLMGRSPTTGLAQLKLWPNPSVSRTLTIFYRPYVYALVSTTPTEIAATTSGDTSILDYRFPATYGKDLINGAMTQLPQYFTPEQLSAATRSWLGALQDAKADAGLQGGEPSRPDAASYASPGEFRLFDTNVT